jgi:hypothetical protein
MTTSGTTGDRASGESRYRMSAAFRLLREAAEAAAVVWSGPLHPQPRDRALHQLGLALGDLRAVGVELAAADRRPQLHEFSRSLDEAWRCAETLPDDATEEPGDVLRDAARHVADVWRRQAPAGKTPDADLAELLGAFEALAEMARELADGAGGSVARQSGNICDWLNAAADQLRSVLPPAAPGSGTVDQRGRDR